MVWEAAAACACLAVVVTLILNIHPVGDGMWFWYAVDLRRGLHLYRDLHLPLQPLYVVLTAAFQIVFGESWLASKILPFLQGMALTLLLVRLARFVPWSAPQRAGLTVAMFLCILRPSTYRFDDYHVTSDLCTLAVFLLLLQLGVRAAARERVLRVSFAMGLCCGMAAMTRLNDGASLCLAAGLSLLLLYPRRALAALTALACGTLLPWAVVLAVLRETPWSWFHWSVRGASAIKGGTGNVLLSPLLLPLHLFMSIVTWKAPLVALFAVALWVAVGRLRRTGQHRRLPWLAEAMLWAVCLLLLAFPLVHRTQSDLPMELLVRLATLLLLVLCGTAATWALLTRWRVLQSTRHANAGGSQSAPDRYPDFTQASRSTADQGSAASPRAEFALLVLPLLHLLGGALTAANTLPDPYLSLAMLLLILPLLVRGEQARQWAWPALANLALACFVVLNGKIHRPYDWYVYTDGPVYRDRVWYRHPAFGPLYIEQPQLALMQSVCARITSGGTPASLLALPFPYPNYFCHLPPWQNNVQTWYDTSSAAVVHSLVLSLEQDPPQWIVYQRDLNAMIAHEVTYHHGQPLPHRALDRLIVERIQSGAWSVRYSQCDRGTHWLVVETRPAAELHTTSPAALPVHDHDCQ